MPLITDVRPKHMDEIIGNELNMRLIKEFIDDPNRPRTYLFKGERGTGKTTVARLFAEAIGVNETGDSNKVDIRESNHADNTGVDFCRTIIADADTKAIGKKIIVHILDEFGLSTAIAQKTFRKPMEEPEPYCYYIMCSSDANKIDKDIKSRAKVLEFKAPETSTCFKFIDDTCSKFGKTISRPVKAELCTSAGNRPRDILDGLESILKLETPEEQLASINIKDDYSADVRSLLLALLNYKGDWVGICNLLKSIKEEPESVRRSIIGFMNWEVLKNTPKSHRASGIIGCFCDHNYFDSGRAGLTYDCYRLLHD